MSRSNCPLKHVTIAEVDQLAQVDQRAQEIATLTQERNALRLELDGRDELWVYWLRRQHEHYLSAEVKAVFDRVWLDGFIASARAGIAEATPQEEKKQ